MQLTNQPSVRRRARWLVLVLSLGVMLGLIAPAQANAATGCNFTLGVGSSGSCVVSAQNALNRAGYDVGRFGSDGKFGAATRAATIKFQKRMGLPQVGWIGPATRAALAKNPGPPASLVSRFPNRKAAATVFIVDKSDKKLYVFKNGVYQRTVVVRLGGKAWDPRTKRWVQKDTPTGKFWVQAKIAAGYSNLYEAKMPYFTVFNGNIGFHYSALFRAVNYGPDGTYGSHGCVNIANMPDAKYVFDTARVGYSRVFVQS